MLPEPFLKNCREILPPHELESFVNSFSSPPYRAIRFHKDKYQPVFSEGLQTTPFADNSFYIAADRRLNRDPLWHSGAFYSQEPSAAAVVNALKNRRFNTVLDLCAAPGGKSLQLNELLHKNGVIVSNELISKRYHILCENLQRAGITNVGISSLNPEKLAQQLPEFFEAVLVDAPCSGEGMFRKKPDTIAQWSPEAINECAGRQRKILKSAILTLKKGGLLVYSTCTFNATENEKNIEWLCQSYPELQLLEMKRIWPHKQMGEGHFFAVLSIVKEKEWSPSPCHKKIPAKIPAFIEDFFGSEYVSHFSENYYFWKTGTLCFFLPKLCYNIRNKPFQRTGLLLGELLPGRKNVFRPSHAAATVPIAKKFPSILALSSEEFYSYICGQDLPDRCTDKGWLLCTFAGLGIGFAKATGTRIQNHFPKALRIV
jgi:16S rRNA C967 or C1407 C5-methylase (RsmB/RsmF family)/NOL1/NOP2/fmu family ribosome biogenesis protein